jgi:atypical dual specificity phosphatase
VTPHDIDTPGDAVPRPHPHCYWLLPGRLLAGRHPQGHVATLEAAGVTHFVDLTELDSRLSYRPQHALHWRHPIADFGLPSVEAMRLTLAAIDAGLACGGTVYLHCRAGIGRTGTTAACWMVEHGLAPEAALALLKHKFSAMVPGAPADATPETEAQRRFVRDWRAQRAGVSPAP